MGGKQKQIVEAADCGAVGLYSIIGDSDNINKDKLSAWCNTVQQHYKLQPPE